MFPLDEGSACCRKLFLTTHDTHKRQISMPLKGFEPAIPANEQQQFQRLKQRGHRNRREFYVFTSLIKKRVFIFKVCNNFKTSNFVYTNVHHVYQHKCTPRVPTQTYTTCTNTNVHHVYQHKLTPRVPTQT
jgi:hypothetical protein